ncbi:unnamed protein product [Symbiodinium necroappetens]|uniref:Uncharacterized protein n=1 Tax=Symbiodinium necroappetens TaxID=1628268 RepID=A0A812P9L0_9DINO|nr:unnamed protein product [Symbiodinium necroappetens]
MASEKDYDEVQQTIFTAGAGNALQAAVASIVRRPLDEVPNFLEDPAGYDKACQTWLAAQRMTWRKISLEDGRLPRDAVTCVGKLCVLRGTSPRGDHGHVVVARACETGLHDPYPGELAADMLKPPFVWAAVIEAESA